MGKKQPNRKHEEFYSSAAFLRPAAPEFRVPNSNGASETYDEVEPYLRHLITNFQCDLRGFMQEVFPWGQYGTFLENFPQPLEWQSRVFDDISNALIKNPKRCRVALSSGRGVGKTAFDAMVYLWHVAAHQESVSVWTATTARQIADRDWRELAKWFRVSKLAPFFHVNRRELAHNLIPTWQGVNLTANEDKPESFHGYHEQAGGVGMFVDETSGVHDDVLLAIERGLSDQRTFVLYTSNPTKISGRFYTIFHEPNVRKNWLTYNIDARDVSIVEKDHIQEILEENLFDENADDFRVHVRGEFPQSQANVLISPKLIEDAQKRSKPRVLNAPIEIGVDVGRYGGSKTIFVVRQHWHILEIQRYLGQDAEIIAFELMCLMDRYHPSHGYQNCAAYIDSVGYGGSVWDLCRNRGYNVFEIQSASSASEDRFHNLRIELWYRMKEWFRKGGCLNPREKALAAQLIQPMYSFDNQGKWLLESKEQLASRGIPSPDEADALAYSLFRPEVKYAGAWPTQSNGFWDGDYESLFHQTRAPLKIASTW